MESRRTCHAAIPPLCQRRSPVACKVDLTLALFVAVALNLFRTLLHWLRDPIGAHSQPHRRVVQSTFFVRLPLSTAFFGAHDFRGQGVNLLSRTTTSEPLLFGQKNPFELENLSRPVTTSTASGPLLLSLLTSLWSRLCDFRLSWRCHSPSLFFRCGFTSEISLLRRLSLGHSTGRLCPLALFD